MIDDDDDENSTNVNTLENVYDAAIMTKSLHKLTWFISWMWDTAQLLITLIPNQPTWDLSGEQIRTSSSPA